MIRSSMHFGLPGEGGPRKLPESRQDKLIFWGFLLLLLGLMVAEVLSDYTPMKLSIVFFLGAWVPLLVLHEAGHAVMTALVGWRVKRVVIGFGRTWLRFALRGIHVEVRWFPLEGFTEMAPTSIRHGRIKRFLVYSAGPGIEAILLCVIVFTVGSNRLLQLGESVSMLLLQAVAAASVMGLVFNLVPHSAETEHGSSANDGLGMIASLFMGDEDLARWVKESKEKRGPRPRPQS